MDHHLDLLPNSGFTYDDLLPHRCPVDGCERSYKSQQSLNKHKKTHSDPLPYKVQTSGQGTCKQELIPIFVLLYVVTASCHSTV